MPAITIKTGDTISGLAAKNGVTVQAIQAANPDLKDINKIYAGASLNIPTALPKSTTPTIQSTTAQRTTDINTQNSYNEILANKNANTAVNSTMNGGAPVNGVTTPTQNNNGQNPSPTTVTVTRYKDNADGTTTNFLSDGTSEVGRYTKNADGTLNFVPLDTNKTPNGQPVDSTDPIVKAENEYKAQTNQQLKDLDTQYSDFTKQLELIQAQNGANYNSQIETIKATAASSRDKLQKSYESLQASRAKAGYQTDAFRYTPTHAEGLITNDENNYISDLADLNVKEQTLLMQAATAKTAKDYDALQLNVNKFNAMQATKSDLLGKLLTSAQETNKRIESEAKILREAAKLPTSADAVTVAKALAPAMVSGLKGLSTDAAEKYLADASVKYSINPMILKSALIDQGVQNLKDAKTLKEKAAGSKPTEGETKKSFINQLNTVLNDPNVKIKGVPVVDVNGFMTPQGYKHLVKQAFQNGINKQDFLEQYSGNFNLDNIDSYGLTSKEKEYLGL